MSTFNSMRLVCFTILLLLSSQTIYSQSSSDFDFGRSLVTPDAKSSTLSQWGDQIKNNKNEAELLLSGFFFIYKELLSSQDGQHCGFHPSCSVYAIQAAKRKGMILGGIMAFDRLTRCNGLSNEKYEIDPKLMRLKDPVK